MAGAIITSSATAAATPKSTPPQSLPPIGGFRRFWRTLKQLFHEVTGAVFVVLAFLWINNALRAWTHDVARWLVVLAGLVAAVFVFYAVSSFRRARKL